MRSFNKVFEIGVPKTGTSSLGNAYKILGLKKAGYNKKLTEIGNSNLESVLKKAESYDAFHDSPWHNIDFKILDERFPNSRFIILERDDKSWYKSMQYQYSIRLQRPWFMNKTKEEIIEWKNKKYRNVCNYFSGRPNDLLILNIFSEEDPWQLLCDFLEIPRPVGIDTFPHLNKRKKSRLLQ